VIGVAFGDVKFASKGMGYVFKIIPNPVGLGRSAFSGIPSVQRLSKLIGYLLTHCGVQDRRHAVTWWGVMKDRRVAKKVLICDFAEGWLAITKREKPKCPACGSRDTWSFGGSSYQKPACSEGYLTKEDFERLEVLRVARVQEMGKVIV
jgi:hypothetical protein